MSNKKFKIEKNNYKVIDSFALHGNDVMATIEFMQGIKPKIGMLIKLDNREYSISGIIVSSDSKMINERMNENTYECKLTLML